MESGASQAAPAERSARLGALIAGIGGVALAASLFLPWYIFPGAELAEGPIGDIAEDIGGAVGVDIGGGVRDAATRTGWEAFEILDVLAVAAAAVAVARAVVVLLGPDPNPQIPGAILTASFGAVALALLAYRAVNPPGIGWDREAGVWVGLFAAGAIVYGSYVAIQAARGGPSA